LILEAGYVIIALPFWYALPSSLRCWWEGIFFCLGSDLAAGGVKHLGSLALSFSLIRSCSYVAFLVRLSLTSSAFALSIISFKRLFIFRSWLYYTSQGLVCQYFFITFLIILFSFMLIFLINHVIINI